jgi:hypothetical protein
MATAIRSHEVARKQPKGCLIFDVNDPSLLDERRKTKDGACAEKRELRTIASSFLWALLSMKMKIVLHDRNFLLLPT